MVVVVVVESTFLMRCKFLMAGNPRRLFFRPQTTKIVSLLDLCVCELFDVNYPSTDNDWPAGPSRDLEAFSNGILPNLR